MPAHFTADSIWRLTFSHQRPTGRDFVPLLMSVGLHAAIVAAVIWLPLPRMQFSEQTINVDLVAPEEIAPRPEPTQPPPPEVAEAKPRETPPAVEPETPPPETPPDV